MSPAEPCILGMYIHWYVPRNQKLSERKLLDPNVAGSPENDRLWRFSDGVRECSQLVCACIGQWPEKGCREEHRLSSLRFWFVRISKWLSLFLQKGSSPKITTNLTLFRKRWSTFSQVESDDKIKFDRRRKESNTKKKREATLGTDTETSHFNPEVARTSSTATRNSRQQWRDQDNRCIVEMRWQLRATVPLNLFYLCALPTQLTRPFRTLTRKTHSPTCHTVPINC